MFTNEQLKGCARWLLTLVGGIVAGFVVSKGWFTADQVTSFFTSDIVMGFVLSGLTAGSSLAWNLISKTKLGTIVAAANANPEAKIITTPANAAATPALPNVVAGAPAVTGL